MGKFIDLTGQRFGRLTVIERAENYITPAGNSFVRWKCRCDCGQNIVTYSNGLLSGHTKSCGCLQKEKVSESGKKMQRHNDYEAFEGYIVGYTSKGDQFFVDLDDFEKVRKYCWNTSAYGYVVGRINGNLVPLHRLIMDAKDGEYVDHINHSLLDNRKSNLRIVSMSQNEQNKRIQSNNTSGVTGVYWNRRRSKWHSRIQVFRKPINLGYYDRFEDAVAVRKAAEEKYFGEYSYDNSMAAVPRIAV